MKHRVAGRRLDRTTEHRTAMFRNQVASLLRHERIHTTTPKAKELKRIFDKVVTLGKKGTPHARRVAFRDLRDAEMIDKLFGPIAERYAKRAGGYTRIIRTGKRHGDNADMAYIELVDRAPAGGEGEKAEAAEKPAKAKKKSETKATDAEKAPKAKAKKAKGE
ncbi:MAG TPA: 50S ribosomal protein L17 [Anaeromyxobacteraceae bacterium]|nr:50S ribosomal protein L17 [Anaeromyxobacteraceae bacterium]